MAQKTYDELKEIFLKSPYFTDSERLASIHPTDPEFDPFALEKLQTAYYRPLGFSENLRFEVKRSQVTFYVHLDGIAPYSVQNDNDADLRQKILDLERREVVASRNARANRSRTVQRTAALGAEQTQDGGFDIITAGEDEFDAQEDREFEAGKKDPTPTTFTQEEENTGEAADITATLERKGNAIVLSFFHASGPRAGEPVAAGSLVYTFQKEEWNYKNWARLFDTDFLSDLVQTDGGFIIDLPKLEKEMGLLNRQLEVLLPFSSIPGDEPAQLKTEQPNGESLIGPPDRDNDGVPLPKDPTSVIPEPTPPPSATPLPEEISDNTAGDLVDATRNDEQFKQTIGIGGFPQLPTSDADVERFKQEMQQRGLLFGGGVVRGIPEVSSDAEGSDDVFDKENEEPFVPDPGPMIGGRQDRPEGPVAEQLKQQSPVQAKAAEALTNPVVSSPSKVKPGSQPAVLIEGTAADIIDNIGKGKNTGLADRPLPEPVPFYNKCSSDKVISGKNNTWIVFGRDRPGGFGSGYGPGAGHTQAGSIDICVGRMSPRPLSFDSQGRKVEIGPLFVPEKYSYDDGQTLEVMDAARINISQKTDLDDNFDLQLPPKTKSSRGIAGIAMKADGIRIMSRKHGIRFITEDAKSVSSKGGQDSTEPMGICLIAANRAKELQPLIKGDNLTHLLKEMLDNQAQIGGAVASLKQDLIKLNAALLQHEHVSPTAGPTVKLPDLMVENTRGLIKLVSVDTPSAFGLQQNPDTLEKKYLEDASKTSIKSKYNKVN